jgi:hypothetical protein
VTQPKRTVKLHPRVAIVDGKKRYWQRPWPPVSIIGLIALTVALIALVPSLMGISVILGQQHRLEAQQRQIKALAKQGVEAHAGGCSFRATVAQSVRDTTRQIADARRYLARVKAGRRVPIPGISESDVAAAITAYQQQRERQKATLKSLGVLRCPKKDTVAALGSDSPTRSR